MAVAAIKALEDGIAIIQAADYQPSAQLVELGAKLDAERKARRAERFGF